MQERPVFTGQQPGEEVQPGMWLRKHWLILLWAMRIPLLILLTFSLLLWGLSVLATQVSFPSSPTGWLLAFLIVLVITSLGMIWEYVLWCYDYFIVTNRRILDFRMIPFFFEKRDEAQLSRVQDVRINIPNFIAILFDFGDVIVQTAGMKGQIVFTVVPNPKRVQTRLFELVAQAQARGGPQPPPTPGVDIEALRRLLGMQPPPELPVPPPTGTSPTQGATSSAGRGRMSVLRGLFLYSPVEGPNLKLWRKHWWKLLGAIIGPMFLLASALLGMALAYGPWPQTLFLLIPILIFGLGWLVWRVVDWYNDIYVVTDERVIDIEKTPLSTEDRREAQLTMIQDVHYLTPGFIAQNLNFGNVEIETAGRAGAFTFDSVPNPREVQKEIFKRLEKARQVARQTEEDKRQAEILEILARYHGAMGGTTGPPVTGRPTP